jgi:hypothetical protein
MLSRSEVSTAITSDAPASPLITYINVKLALLGFEPVGSHVSAEFGELVSTLVAQYREKERLWQRISARRTIVSRRFFMIIFRTSRSPNFRRGR